MLKACPLCGSTELDDAGTVKDHSISGEVFHLVSCSECNFTMTADAPDQSEIGRYYQSDVYISHSDTQKGLTDKLYHSVRKRMLKRKHGIVERHSPRSGGELLDIGSGTGYFPGFMKSQGWKVEGIEVDETARNKSIAQFDLTVFDQSYMSELPASRFDVVTMWHVLEHVQDLQGYGQQIRNTLSDDGVLIIAVPNFTSKDAQHYGEYWAAWDVPRHLWHFSPLAMRKFAQGSGFEVAQTYPMPMDAYYVSLLSEKYRGRAGVSALAHGTWHGLLSNLNAQKDKEESSSVIYILKKK